MKSQPQFVVVGAQKAGSTYLHRCLAEHPEIYMPTSEVTYFEDPDYDPSAYDKFLASFYLAKPQQIAGFKRPSYLGRPECPRYLRRHLPNIKIIVILRNPVRRMISAYFHYMRGGFIPAEPIDVGFPKLMAGDYLAQYPRAAEIVEYGFYHKHLTRYLDYFPRKHLLIHRFKQLRLSPLKMVQSSYKFLGVDPDYIPEGIDSRPQKGVYSLTRIRLLRLRNQMRFRHNSERTRSYAKKQVNPAELLLAKAILVLDRGLMAKITQGQRPQLDEGLLNRLRELYREDIIRLEELLGQDLADWQKA